MKKRFLNILDKKGKKNGAGLFLCAIVFTFIFGTLIGCTVTKEAANDTDDTANPPKTEELHTVTEPASSPDSGSWPAAEIPQSGQIYGYISEFNSESVVLNRQLWITMESEDWKPEYDADAGFEVVDAESDDITYPIHKDCTYAALENHQGPLVELGRTEFESYLRDMEFPVLWIVELEDGQIKRISEQYRP